MEKGLGGMEKGQEALESGREPRELVGNQDLENYIGMLQREPSQDLLIVTLTSVRRTMQAGGQLIVPVAMPEEQKGLEVPTMEVEGEKWLVAYTSFEEQLAGNERVMSTFLADYRQLLVTALKEEKVAGLLLNPWRSTLRLDKNLIRIVLGA